MARTIPTLPAAATFMLTLIVAGCASNGPADEKKDQYLFWPSPPQTPRVQ